ncbi:PAS domain-containing sensor histidine kinase [Natronomonas halophila]|uniref:two-component system sensor histidine kinase NtrB n=1 Tax=Natronomonas halophila TaxID=2747817 RepID=UPI0015B3FD27|nr:PAS domain-containing sensor histidine kinase [Natronomonas halophila]QLD84809.1 PAS domain-containing sensor histidine kinase [Natronomonas halophila]
MGRFADALPVGPLLVLGGIAAIAVAGQRAYAAETLDPILILALTPVFLSGGFLLSLGVRVRTLSADSGRVLLWTVAGAAAVGFSADAVLLRTRVFGAELDPLLMISTVASVGAAGGAIAAFVDTRRRNTVGDLEARAERAERTLDAARGFVVARLDPEGYIEDWSEGAADLTGFAPGDVVGARLDALYPEHSDREPKQDLQRALRTDAVEFEDEFRQANGETFYGRGTLTAVQDDDTLLGYVLLLADRSDERAKREQLERRNAQLEAFASVVSHDLRNPLNVAIGNIGMAKGKEDNEQQLQTAEESLERMEKLIEEVLTLARQGKDVDEFERVDLEETVSLAWSSVDEMWAELDYGDLQDITADGERVRRLFENLFRNAIEHGGEDARIRVGMIDDEGFFVEDNGPGIPKHKRDEIFDAGFTTGDEGTGLGLAIVQSIAEAHGWDIEAAESSSGGARFEITGVQTLADR